MSKCESKFYSYANKGDYTVKTNNHAFNLSFRVDDSNFSDPSNCLEVEKQKVICSLLKRIAEVMETSDLSGIECCDELSEELVCVE